MPELPKLPDDPKFRIFKALEAVDGLRLMHDNLDREKWYRALDDLDARLSAIYAADRVVAAGPTPTEAGSCGETARGR